MAESNPDNPWKVRVSLLKIRLLGWTSFLFFAVFDFCFVAHDDAPGSPLPTGARTERKGRQGTWHLLACPRHGVAETRHPPADRRGRL